MISEKNNCSSKPTEKRWAPYTDRDQCTRMTAIQGLFLIALLTLLGGLATFTQPAALSSEGADRDFLKRHWQVPVPPQGPPPAKFSSLESALDPASCGVCHQTQFEDWKTTIHSRSVGPGLLGQTPSLLQNDPDTAVMCYTCHAPLSEQQEVFQKDSRFKRNLRFDSALQKQGLTCAGCHVRNYQRFGPPRRDGTPTQTISAEQLPHGGAIRTAAFEQAEFCMGCHQFGPEDRSLNGKLLENTYNEWKDSPYPEQGIACQRCHMPDRRHLWRGIHDPEMVKQGVAVKLETSQPHYLPGETLQATLTLTNVGVGHFFPSYVTPHVVLQMQLLDGNGRLVAGSMKVDTVGRHVTLDLAREISDTRIPPKGNHAFRYERRIEQQGWSLQAIVKVYPDEFYRRFYEAKRSGNLSAVERKRLGEALKTARTSSYVLFEKTFPL